MGIFIFKSEAALIWVRLGGGLHLPSQFQAVACGRRHRARPGSSYKLSRDLIEAVIEDDHRSPCAYG